MSQRILVVDDEVSLVKGLKLSLEQAGYAVEAAHDGPQALGLWRSKGADLIILDLMLPGMDGLAVCREIRKSSQVPIIMLTAKGEDVDKIIGLELGADDYQTKPFNTRELLARIKAVLRRAQAQNHYEVLSFNGVTIDRERRRVTVGDQRVELTAKEFDLLARLASHPGRVFTREELLSAVWGYDYFGDDRTVDVHIRRLREKVEENPGEPRLILTSWGRGYYFSDAGR
ncbi:MAG: response regulator transcription factor [Bacillota bacterium]